MKKRYFALLLAFVMAFSFAACAGGGSQSGNDGETVLTFAYKQVNNDPLEKFFDEYDIIEAFEAEHPGVKVELRTLWKCPSRLRLNRRPLRLRPRRRLQ